MNCLDVWYIYPHLPYIHKSYGVIMRIDKSNVYMNNFNMFHLKYLHEVDIAKKQKNEKTVKKTWRCASADRTFSLRALLWKENG